MDGGTLGIIIALAVQTLTAGVLLGKLLQTVKHHDGHIHELRKWKHDDVTPRLFRVDELWDHHTERRGA